MMSTAMIKIQHCIISGRRHCGYGLTALSDHVMEIRRVYAELTCSESAVQLKVQVKNTGISTTLTK